MPTKQQTPISNLRSAYQLTRKEFARVLELSERRIADLETGKAQSTPAVKRRVTEARRLHADLSLLIDADAIGPWMKEPNRAFDGLKPLEVIERGETDRLWQMIYELKSGNPG